MAMFPASLSSTINFLRFGIRKQFREVLLDQTVNKIKWFLAGQIKLKTKGDVWDYPCSIFR